MYGTIIISIRMTSSIRQSDLLLMNSSMFVVIGLNAEFNSCSTSSFVHLPHPRSVLCFNTPCIFIDINEYRARVGLHHARASTPPKRNILSFYDYFYICLIANYIRLGITVCLFITTNVLVLLAHLIQYM